MNELFKLGGLVRCFADDLDDNVIEGGLRIDVGNTDFAVLEVEFTDTFLDSLLTLEDKLQVIRLATYTSADRNRSDLGFQARNELRSFPVKELDIVNDNT